MTTSADLLRSAPVDERPRLVILPSPPFYAHYRQDFFSRLAERFRITWLLGEAHPAMRMQNEFPPSGVDYRLIPWRDRADRAEPRLAVRAGLAAYRGLNPDGVVLYGNINEPLVHVLLMKAKLARIPVFAWTQYHRAGSSLRRDVVKQLWTRLFSGVLLYTDREAEEYRRDGYPAARICALNNGLAPIPTPVRDVAMLVAKGDFIFCARLESKNRLDLLLRAFDAYAAAGGRRRLVVVGGGPEADRYRSIAAALTLGERVVFAGARFKAELDAAFARAAFMVHPFGIGLSINTAFARGVPLIACADARMHMPEFWLHEDGRTGFGFPRGMDEDSDERALTATLLRCDRIDAATYEQMSAGALAAAARASTAVMAERFTAFVAPRLRARREG